jgi:ComEC/Rec2-related protein
VAGSDYLRAEAGLGAWEDDPGRDRPAPARRSLAICGLIALGYLLARVLAETSVGAASSWWFAAGPVMLIVACLTSGLSCKVALGSACVVLAAGWCQLRLYERPTSSLGLHIVQAQPETPTLVRVVGVIEDWPAPGERTGLGPAHRAFARPGSSTSFTLNCLRLVDDAGGERAVSGRVRVRLAQPITALPPWFAPGAVAAALAELELIAPASNPGEPARELYAAQEHLVGTLRVPDAALLQPRDAQGLGERLSSWKSGSLGRLHAWAARALAATDPEAEGELTTPRVDDPRRREARALLGAMLLGTRDSALEPVSDAFARTGLVHLVAISGFNLVVMGGVALFLLRLSGDRGMLEPLVLALLIMLYMLVLPAQASIVRSGLLVLAVLASHAMGRRYDHASVLGWVAACILIWRPMELWSLGFQLSAGIVAALLIFGPGLHERLWGAPLRGVLSVAQPPGRMPLISFTRARGLVHWLSEAIKGLMTASLLAWAVSTPIIAWSTGVISPLAPVAGLIALPIAVVLLWCAYLAVLVGSVVSALGSIGSWMTAMMGGALDGLATGFIWLIEQIDQFPGSSLNVPAFSVVLAIVATALIVALGGQGRSPFEVPAGPAGRDRGRVRGRVRGRFRRGRALVATAGVLLWAGLELVVPRVLLPPDRIRLDVLDIRDGSCQVLRAGGDAVLIDAGSRSGDIGRRLVPDALRSLGIGQVKTAIVTRDVLQCISALPALAEKLGLQRVFMSEPALDSARRDRTGFAAMVNELKRMDIEIATVAAGDDIVIGRARVRVLWPPRIAPPTDLADCGLVFAVTGPGETGSASTRLLVAHAASPRVVSSIEREVAELASLEGSSALTAPDHEPERAPSGAHRLASALNAHAVILPTDARRVRVWSDRAGPSWWITPRDGAAFAQLEPGEEARSGPIRAWPRTR